MNSNVKSMKESLKLQNNTRLEDMITIKDQYLSGELDLESARALLKEKVGTCTPDEFAYGEQQLKGSYTDEEITHRMDDLLELFDGILIPAENTYPVNHPLWVYMEEITAMNKVLGQMEDLLKAPHFIKNPWLGIYDELTEWRRHLSRKQNQLYAALESYGFDRPTKIMWTFDDAVRDIISEGAHLLSDIMSESSESSESNESSKASQSEKITAFLTLQERVIDRIHDLNDKEMEVLLPTSIKLVSDAEFVDMSKGDHEVGFALIDTPPLYTGNGESTSTHSLNSTDNGNGLAPTDTSLDDASLSATFTKTPTSELNLAIGKLDLEQIKLIFKILPVDLTYVDEHDQVRFYNDTKHRIFPRSSNIIGRLVQNCHPAKSLPLVQEIIDKFRAGEQDYAEMWINKPDLFIHIEYMAVRGENGEYKGILEMVQDCTHIRSLSGERKELIWNDRNHIPEANTYRYVRGNKPSSTNSTQPNNANSTQPNNANSTQPSNTASHGTASATATSHETIVDSSVATNTTQLSSTNNTQPNHADTSGNSNVTTNSTTSQAASNTSLEVDPANFTADTKLFPLFDAYPGLKEFMPTIHPMFKMLSTPMAKLMKNKATLGKIASRSDLPLETIITKMTDFIKSK